MKYLFKNKRHGNIADIMGTSICLMFLVVIFMSFVRFCSLIEYKRQLNEVARDYLLKIETTGKLSDQELTDLENEILDIRPNKDKGTYTYTITFNEDNHPAQYGENVSINIIVNASYDAMNLQKMYEWIKDEYVFEANYYSTSKQ